MRVIYIRRKTTKPKKFVPKPKPSQTQLDPAVKAFIRAFPKRKVVK